MTVKELAKLTARTERTVRRWIQKVELSSDTMAAKMSDAQKTNIPADFTLEETGGILRASTVPKVVVNNLMESARTPVQSLEVKTDPNQMDVLFAFMERQQQVNQEFMKTVLVELKGINKPLQIEQPKQDYYSLVAYCSLNKIKTVSSELRKMGMDLRKMSKDSGKELHKIPDERYGQVNSYPLEILEEYFSE